MRFKFKAAHPFFKISQKWSVKKKKSVETKKHSNSLKDNTTHIDQSKKTENRARKTKREAEGVSETPVRE